MLFTRPKEPFYPRFLSVGELQSCCGIDTLDFFPTEPDEEGTIKEMKARVVEEIKHYRSTNWNSVMLVSLTTGQRRLYNKILLNEGFDIVLQGVKNKNSGNKLTLYAWRHDGRTPHGKVKKKKGKPSVASNRRHRGEQPLPE